MKPHNESAIDMLHALALVSVELEEGIENRATCCLQQLIIHESVICECVRSIKERMRIRNRQRR